MASVPVMISGVLWDNAWKTSTAVTLLGIAEFSAPASPPERPHPPPGGGGPVDPGYGQGRPIPPHIWRPIDPGWGVPPPGTEEPPKPPAGRDGFWAWSPIYGWVFIPGKPPEQPDEKPPEAPEPEPKPA